MYAPSQDAKQVFERPEHIRTGLHKTALSLHAWAAQLVDPLRLWRGLRGLGWYWADLLAYRRLPQAEPIRWANLTPALHERSTSHELDAHYFYLNAWAARRIVAAPASAIQRALAVWWSAEACG